MAFLSRSALPELHGVQDRCAWALNVPAGHVEHGVAASASASAVPFVQGVHAVLCTFENLPGTQTAQFVPGSLSWSARPPTHMSHADRSPDDCLPIPHA